MSQANSGPIRVLCVDDHIFLIEGIRARFELEDDIECVGQLESADRLLDEVERLRPDIVLLDIEMPGPDPFDTAAEIARRFEDVRVAFLSAYVRDNYISAAIRAGAWGYFSKSDGAKAIIDGIRKVKNGEFVLGPAVAKRRSPGKNPFVASVQESKPVSRLDSLTQREQEVLRLIGRGLSRTQIAEMLSRSPKTVDGHREKIMAKLDIHSVAELVRFAIREGVVEA